jgi:hypothetical protein
VVGLFNESRRFFLDHPGIAEFCVARPTPVSAVARFYDLTLGALAEGGFSGADAVRTFDTLLMFMFGSVLWEIPRSDTIRERLVEVAVRDTNPHVINEEAALRLRDAADYFRFGLELILAGLEQRHGGARARPASDGSDKQRWS